MINYIRKSILLTILAITFTQSGIGQKLRTDTVYYDNTGELVTRQSDYVTYEVRQLYRKKRIDGMAHLYTKSGRLTESTTYVKGEKTGDYYRYNQAEEVIISGYYKNSLKTGLWVTHDNDRSIVAIEEYDDSGNLISKYERPDSVKTDDAIKLDTYAKFVGGEEKWNLHLRNNLKYPLEAKRAGYQGDVFMTYTILANGKLSDLKILYSPHEVLSTEALRMLEISPNWIPAMVGDKPVDSQATLRIAFRLR